MNNFNRTADTPLPREGEWCETIDSAGRITILRRSRNLWFLPDGTYVYYTPTMWRYKTYDDYH